MTVPLQIKLISQWLMVSTRNTSRSHSNPPRMRDQQGDIDIRPPGGTLETIQVNTDEVEALRLTNQCLLRELYHSPCKYNTPKRHDRPKKAKTLLLEKNNTSTLIEKQIEKEILAMPRSITLTNPPEKIAMRRGMARTTKAMGPSCISRRQRSGCGSRGSGTSSKSSAT